MTSVPDARPTCDAGTSSSCRPLGGCPEVRSSQLPVTVRLLSSQVTARWRVPAGSADSCMLSKSTPALAFCTIHGSGASSIIVSTCCVGRRWKATRGVAAHR